MNPQVGEIWFVRSATDFIDDEYYLITKREDTPNGKIICSLVRLNVGDTVVGYLWDDRVNWVKHF
jgi:hypothetical protein